MNHFTEAFLEIQIDTYGGYEQLKLTQWHRPAPTEVQIKVFAAGINYADCIVEWTHRSAGELVGLPITPGFEVSGVVSAVGDQVTEFGIGDEDGSHLLWGYASFITVGEAYVFPKPSAYSFIEAAGSLATFLTAHYGLIQLANPRMGDKVRFILRLAVWVWCSFNLRIIWRWRLQGWWVPLTN